MSGEPWFYDREGNPLTIEEADALLGDPEYRRVARDEIGPHTVSTVWLGVNHRWDRAGPPVIFETMVFGPSDGVAYRYSTEADARAGHEEVCTLVRATHDIDTPEERNHSESQNR